MKIDDDYGLVASDDELNIYRRLDKRKDAFYDDRKYEIMNGWTLSKKELYALEYDSDKLVAEWHV